MRKPDIKTAGIYLSQTDSGTIKNLQTYVTSNNRTLTNPDASGVCVYI